MGYGLLAVPTMVGTMEASELKRMESKPLTHMLHGCAAAPATVPAWAIPRALVSP